MPVSECLQCGFVCDGGEIRCPKCDALLSEQTDGSTLTVDVAHGGETVVEATESLERALARALSSHARTLRVVTGHGAIRAAILPLLTSMSASGRVVSFAEDGRNRGAFLVTLRRARGRR